MFRHEAEPERTLIDWAGLPLETGYRPDVGLHQPISFVVPDGFVVLHPRDRPSRGEHENPVPGVVDAMLAFGQTAQIALEPRHYPSRPVHFSVPLHVARRNRLAPGAQATVSLLAEGIHLMPASDRAR